MQKITTQLRLPSHFRADDFFAFHLRDQHNIAEIVEGNLLRKGILWGRSPAQLLIAIDGNQATMSLEIDKGETQPCEQKLVEIGKHMLGLQQAVEQFEAQYLSHPILGKLIQQQQGLRIYQSTSPFEALIWAIIGQQISVTAAIAIRRRFIQATGSRHSSGIWCFPDAQQVTAVDDLTLRQTGLSASKLTALRALCAALLNHHIDLTSPINAEEVQKLSSQLVSLKGIGPWTVSYALLRGFNYLDGSLHGDVAVRRNLQSLLGMETQPTAKETEKWLEEFTPWRALVAAHLWRSQSAAGY
ncbi:3-methyladenine DNA glycosylase 2 [Providencia stuartii]|uniref:DNA-3-methyladenine glycosylase family protein n=1 Tax=Providencia stuartii TaxID=588 RepID=UPI0023E2E199|nr:3-methyladenine DNA glycosylase 2 [Providencia stuartii]ELR5143753.1 DNA-3-methyladenine glycosylase 2 [Providencia stuartii]WER22471.1 3-methyladenine DNA glycosylase 2 [Providencia stuartii]WER26591.1 3-methyladenine DNA glycosylase 2 [Providencia stuartii]WER30681.1 3-methyladenine DNA glycosylase 2 [Providencia stuartii]